jgi:hypothetical protein
MPVTGREHRETTTQFTQIYPRRRPAQNSFAVFALSRPITQMSDNRDPQQHCPEGEHTLEWQTPEFQQPPVQPGGRIAIELPGEQQAASRDHADGEPTHARGHRVSLTAASVTAVLAACLGAALTLTVIHPIPRSRSSLRPSTSTKTELTAPGPRSYPGHRDRPRQPARSTTAPRAITRAGSDTAPPEPHRAPAPGAVVSQAPSSPVGQADEQTQGGAFSP